MGESEGCVMKSKKYFAIEFTALFSMSMIIHMVINNTSMYYDDAVYWWLGKACGFDVRNIDWGFRGWVLPYIYSICYQFGMLFNSEFLGYRIFSSLIFAFTFTFSFSYITEMLKIDVIDKRKNVFVCGGICSILFFVFFRGLLIYTLSDFYAFSFALFSVSLLYSIVESEQKVVFVILKSFFLGVCLYGTYNIRTIYLFLLIACGGVLVIWQSCQKKWKQLMITIPVCFGGMVVCAVPQYILNNHLLGRLSWRVPTEGLMLKQLEWGITAGRYATFIGDASQYSKAGMFFRDKVGQTILEKAQVTELTSYGQLIKLILKHPLDFVGIYMRHFLNMLYPFYPNQYIEDIMRDKSFLMIVFYTLLFIAVFYFVRTFKLKDNRWVWFALILLPCICILPGAVEIRFFIALHFLIYLYAVFGFKNFFIELKRNKLKYCAMYLLGLLLYIAYAGALLATTENGIATIN